MLQHGQMIVLLLVCIALGCDGVQQAKLSGSKPYSGSKQREPVEVPINWVSNRPQIRRVELAEQQFKTPELRATVKRWETVAEKFCKNQASMADESMLAALTPAWHHEPWYLKSAELRGNGDQIVQWWSNTPQQVSPVGHVNYFGSEALHDLHGHSISFGMSPKNPVLEYVSLQSLWVPRNGWGAELDCGSRGNGIEQIRINFIHRGHDAKDLSFDIFLSKMAEWRHHVEREEPADLNEIRSHYQRAGEQVVDVGNRLNFTLWVYLPHGTESHNPTAANRVYERLLAMRKSPDDFQQVSLQMLDELADKIEADFASGLAVKEASYWGGMGSGCHGVMPMVFEVNKSMTNEELQTALEVARAYVTQRRAWIEEHHVKLHAALVNVFPLDELDEPKPQSEQNLSSLSR